MDETKQYLTEQGMDAGSADELYYTLVGILRYTRAIQPDIMS